MENINWDLVIPFITTVIGCLVGWLFTRHLTKGGQATTITTLEVQLLDIKTKNQQLQSQYEATQKEMENAKSQIVQLKEIESQLTKISNTLKRAGVAVTYYQPVVLVGPRNVGKTSLLMQWNAPWNHSILTPTSTYNVSHLPIHDFLEKDLRPHFACPEFMTQHHVHLALKVHDFPGEISSQTKICEIIVEETEKVRRDTGKNLGIVLVCMFDSEEVVKGLSADTLKYYNGDLFSNIRRMVSHSEIFLDKLVIVFNKYDNLKKNYDKNTVNDRDLLNICVNKLSDVLKLLHGICNPEKVCEIFTILGREDMIFNNQGATIALGEASRNFVESFIGQEATDKIFEHRASNISAEKFL